MPNHFTTLFVSSEATWEDVRASYRRLARDAHPDRPGGDLKRMREITAAYEALKTPQRLEDYRRKLHAMEAPLPPKGTQSNDPDLIDGDGSVIFSRGFRAIMRDALDAELKSRSPKRTLPFSRLKRAQISAASHVPYGLTHTGPCVRIFYPGSIQPGLNLFAVPHLTYIPDTMALAYKKTACILDRTYASQIAGSVISVTRDELGPSHANCALMFDEEPDQAAWLRGYGLI